ncbi:MAG TPA: hypothetical protein VK420_05125 [Longimicrobium sp.]|nr:hypothetical protein [Longimicrobium sp.]
MRRWIGWMGWALALGACRGDGDAPAPAETVVEAPAMGPTLAVEIPAPMAWNAEDTVVLTLANRGATALQGVRVRLSVAGPARVPPPAPGDPAAPVVDSADGGMRVTWTLPGVAQGAAIELRHAVRTPPAPGKAAAPPPSFMVRAELLSASGAALAPAVQDTLRIRPGSEATAGGCATSGAATAQRYGIGPVRLGMSSAALRAACPEARDTTWSAEGMAEKGLRVSLGTHPVVAQVVGDSVTRVVALTPGVRAAAGVGIGSTVGELRTRYGRLCTARAEGRVAVWSPNAPGVSFGLAPADSAVAPPDSLADAARVASLWVHGQDTPCPAPPAQGTP